MTRFIEGLDRRQTMLLPECLDDHVDENSPVRAIDAFADMLGLSTLGFNAQAAATGRPGYHPGLMLRIYLYGYLNQVQSSRRLERECGRNLELIWLTGRLKPDFKTIADFRKDNGPAIRKVCQQFVALCRNMDLLDGDVVAIDGSRFKAVNAKAKNDTRGKLRQKLGEIDKAIERYLGRVGSCRRGVRADWHGAARGANGTDPDESWNICKRRLRVTDQLSNAWMRPVKTKSR